MQLLPAGDLRSNLGTWAVPDCRLPAVARALTAALPPEDFDPDFRGQELETTYFDTRKLRLRAARRNKDRYLTLRVRRYCPSDTYALSAKTEGRKFRAELAPEVAGVLLARGFAPVSYDLLPADLVARLLELAGDEPLVPVVCVGFTRYAVEDAADRLTLDVGLATDTGKCYPSSVLEYKSADVAASAPAAAFGLRPLKLSKFLWSLS